MEKARKRTMDLPVRLVDCVENQYRMCACAREEVCIPVKLRCVVAVAVASGDGDVADAPPLLRPPQLCNYRVPASLSVEGIIRTPCAAYGNGHCKPDCEKERAWIDPGNGRKVICDFCAHWNFALFSSSFFPLFLFYFARRPLALVGKCRSDYCHHMNTFLFWNMYFLFFSISFNLTKKKRFD